MSHSFLFLGLSFHNRFNLRHPIAVAFDEVDLPIASFPLTRELAPQSSNPVLRVLCADGVRVTVSSGSVVVRVDCLTRSAAQLLADADLADLSANAGWNLWLERCAAHQAENKPRVLVDDVRWLGRLRAEVLIEPLEAMEHHFIPWTNGSLSQHADLPLARHLLHAVRALADDDRCMIWFGSVGRKFTYSTFSQSLIRLYSKMFTAQNAPRGFSPAHGAEHEVVYSGEAGFFVFSQAGLVELASKFVSDVVGSASAEKAGEFDVAFGSDAVVRFGDATTRPQMESPWLVLFVDASGCDFDESDQLFRGLLSVLEQAPRVLRLAVWLFDD